MAVIALYAAGAAIGGAMNLAGVGMFAAITSGMIGGAIGGMVGSYIDSQFIFPTIFGAASQTLTGPRLDSLQIQSASEGTAIKLCFGPENRIAGTIIYLSDLIETVSTVTSHAGKGMGGGGGSTTQTTYLYAAHVAIGLCEGPIEGVDKIWADAKLIYDGSESYVGHLNVEVDGGSNRYFIPSPVSGYAYFPGFTVGRPLRVFGFTDSANNGTHTVVAVGDDYIEVAETLVTEGPNFVDHSFFQDARLDPRYEAIEIHLGTATQSPSTILQAVTGEDQPAYRGTAYVVLQNLQLRDFGNRIPLFTFLVREKRYTTAGEVIQQIISRSIGSSILSLSAFSTGEVRGDVRGYSLAEPMTVAQQLEPLMLAYNITVAEVRGDVYFFTRGREHSVEINPAHLAAHESGQTAAARRLKVSEKASTDLPSTVFVNFLEPGNNYQQGGVPERRANAPSPNIETYTLPLVMTAAQARNIAKRILWASYVEQAKVEVSLPGNLFEVHETDILSFTLDDEAYNIRIDTIERGANHLLMIRGMKTEPQTFQSTSEDDEPNITPSPIYTPSDSLFHLLDIPAVRDEDVETSGTYVAVALDDPDARWRSATVFFSTNGGTTYLPFSTAPQEATMGVCSTVLAAADPAYWDTANALSVTLEHGTLISRTEDEVLDGANMVVVGDELIAFRTATLTAPRQYTLTNLLRGLRGTEHRVGTHGASERFVLLSGAGGVNWTAVPAASLELERPYRVASAGQSVDDQTDTLITLHGRTLQQFAPAQLTASRAGSGDITATWLRRSRALTRPFGSYFPLLADSETYRVECIAASTVIRTATVTINPVDSATPQFVYTAANQTSDGYTYSPNSLTFRVAQLGPLGYGTPAEIII